MTHDHLISGKKYLEQHKDFKLVGRDNDLKKLIAILARSNANSILLVGAGGVGSSAICLGLEQKKLDDDAPFDLINKRFFWLDTDGLFASGDLTLINESFQKTIKTLSRTPNCVLIIDDMSDFINAARSNGACHLINALMHCVKSKDTQVIYETRDEDLESVLKSHSDFTEHYTMLDVGEPSPGALYNIVISAKERLEKHHKITICDSAVQSAIDLTSNYRVSDMGLSRAQPERTLTLLDRALTSYKLNAHSKDPRIVELELELESLKSSDKPSSEIESESSSIEQNINELKQEWNEFQKKIKDLYKELREGEENIRTLEDELIEQRKKEAEAKKSTQRNEGEGAFVVRDLGQESDEITNIQNKLSKFQEAVEERKSEFDALTKTINDRLKLEGEHVLEQFSIISGIPVNKLTQDEKAKLLNLDKNLSNRVYGQDDAITKLANQVRVSKAGLQDANKPQASFLFLGPSGVGKTELAKALTFELLDDENALLRFDMSEYMEKHAVAKLIGAPPGYEGYEAGGILTNEMRRNPRRIILFDEIEKAHPDVFNVFLQILDDARLTDNRGLTVSFRDAIILMTTNIGTSHFLNNENFEEARELALEDLDKEYRPEFLNRFNGRQNIVCFNTLSLDVIESIAKRDLDKLSNMVNSNMPKLSVSMPASDLSQMCSDHYKPINGARGITGYIEGYIKPEIANTVLFDSSAEGDIIINYDNKTKMADIKPPTGK